MAPSLLLALNNEGKPYSLATNLSLWREIESLDLEFIKLSAIPNFIWATGTDGQIYLNVHSLDIPIRACEVAYENERRYPGTSFTQALLPTDRPRFSSEDGLTERNNYNDNLPSPAWEWESKWQVDLTLDGVPLKNGGWTYAVDFPRTYKPQKSTFTCVRRRKWIRWRKYAALNSWFPINDEQQNDKYIDCCVGGTNLVKKGSMIVWAVKDNGQVMYRSEISKSLPEGKEWILVDANYKISQISVSPTGVTWAVCENGNALVRSGVSRDNPLGKSWIEVLPPCKMNLNQIVVGIHSVWALTSDFRVWYRNITDSVVGTIWVEMVEKMSSLSIASNDQLFAVGFTDRCLYMRSGISTTNPTGKEWKKIHCQAQMSRNSNLSEDDGFVDSQYCLEWDVNFSKVASGAVSVDPTCLPKWFKDSLNVQQTDLSKPWRLNILNSLKARNRKESIGFEDYEKVIVESASWTKSGEVKVVNFNETYEDCSIELQLDSISTDIGCGTFIVLNSDGSTKIQFFLNEITCVMSCSQPGNPRLAIFSPRLESTSSPLVLQFLSDVDLEDWLSHLSYATSVHNNVTGCPSNNSIWITNALGEVFVIDSQYKREFNVSGNKAPYAVKLPNGMLSGSSLKITGFVYEDSDQFIIDLQSHASMKLRKQHEPEYLLNTPLRINPQFSEGCIFLTSMELSKWNEKQKVSKLFFTPGKEFELVIKSESDGFHIYFDDEEVCFYGKQQCPKNIVSINCSGRVKLYKVIYEDVKVIFPLNDVFYRQIGGHLRKVETCKAGITWGIGYDCTLWCYTKGWGGFLKTLETSNKGINSMSDFLTFKIYENQRWFMFCGFSTASLPTDRKNWSDVTGRHEKSKDLKLPSSHWQFVSDWTVDFTTPDGVDEEGWQYAIDFPATYHPKKNISDMVRRRRWYRKARLNIKGPWVEVGETKIIDLSLKSFRDTELISVWAISEAGIALFRKGVTLVNPSGDLWEHISCDVPLKSISCSDDNKIWAVAKNGSIFYRSEVTYNNPTGEAWNCIKPPPKVQFKQVSAGVQGVWALDTYSRLIVRIGINPLCPEGSSWQIIENTDDNLRMGFKCVSVGKIVMAISKSGYICKRNGINEGNPCGSEWDVGIMGDWNWLSANAY